MDLASQKDTNYSLWKSTKKTKRSIRAIPPIRKGLGPWARDNEQTADLFAENLAEILQPNQMDEENDLEHIENHIYKDISLVTQNEMDSEIRTNLNPKKGSGFDLITGAI